MSNVYSRSEEDYLEAIYRIGLENKRVRVKDVAEAVGVTMPSVVSAVRLLSDKGLVEQELYGPIKLTPTGKQTAKGVYERHKMLYAFFHEVLGVEPDIAEKDACLVEHYLSPETGRRLTMMLEHIENCCGEKDQALFVKRFKEYVRTGIKPGSCSGCKVLQP